MSGTRLLLALAGGLALWLAAGCENMNWNRPGAHPPAAPSDEFEANPNRAPTARTLYAFAKVLMAEGKEAESQVVLLKIIHEFPDFLPAYCDLAQLQVRINGPEQAIRTLSAGLAVAPNDAVLLNNLGMCWLVKGEYEKALEVFTKAAGLAPLEARYRANMATALAMMGRQGESLALYRQAMSASDAAYNVDLVVQMQAANTLTSKPSAAK